MSDQHRSSGRARRRSSAEIRAEIEATRARLAGDIDAARAKLSRRGLEREAMSALRGARQEGRGALADWSTTADRQVSRLSDMAVDTIKRYPLVSTLVGLGIALLAFSNGRRSGSRSEPSDRGGSESDAPFVKPTARADLPPSAR